MVEEHTLRDRCFAPRFLGEPELDVVPGSAHSAICLFRKVMAVITCDVAF